MTTKTQTAESARTERPWTKLAAGAGVLIALYALGRYAGGALPAIVQRIEALGPWGPAAFILIYALATVAFVPGSVLTLAAGALFGIVEGTIYVFIAASAGAIAAFLIARYAAREAIARRLRDNPRFAAVDRAMGHEGRKIVLLLRLSPVFPFNLLNYALGLTDVRLRDYTIGCLGMIPGTLLYVYYGKVAGDVALAASGVRSGAGPAYYALLGGGLVATVVVTVIITRAARRALREEIGEEPTR